MMFYFLNCNLHFAIWAVKSGNVPFLMPNMQSLILIKNEIKCKYRNFFVTLHPKIKEKCY